MNPKKIGNAWEREIAYKFSEWVTGEKDRLVIWRNVHSGTVSTVAKKRGIEFKESGDFRCTDPEFNFWFDKFHIDSKSLKEINFLIKPSNLKSNNLYQEWIKTVSDAKEYNKIPLMPVQLRGKRAQLMVYPTDLMYQNIENGAYKSYLNKPIKELIPSINYVFPETSTEFSLSDLSLFLEAIKYKDMYDCNK